jgi:hypothetical protein
VDSEGKKRYEGRMFLKFIEAYILDAIGQLTDDERQQLAKVEPILRDALKLDGDWKQIVEQQMDIGPEFSVQVKKLWEKNRGLAAAAGETLSPRDFVVMFVDHHFPNSA